MRNNKKGFTLTELIAVIVILSLIISLATISVLAIRKNVLKKDYNNLVTYLETKAAEYANETNITTISVEDLIKEGKISPDDQNTVYNPETKESMNCYIIKSTFENGKYTSTLSTNLGMSNGKCNTYEKTDKYEICRYDESTKKCTSFKSTDWFKEDISLSIKYTNDKNNTAINSQDVTFNWTSTNGFSSSEKIIKTETNLINQSTYKCEVTEGNSQGEVNGKVNIDKQAPAIDEIELNTGWAAKKDVIIKATDMGSGISGFAFVKNGAECKDYVQANSFEVKSEGSYKYCVKDKAGNITESTVTIDKIDSTVPKAPTITPSDGMQQANWHKSDFKLSFSGSETGKSTITYYFNTVRNNLVLIGNEVSIDSSYSRKTMYVKACNEAGICSSISSYEILLDGTAPTYESGGSIGAGAVGMPTYKDNEGGSGNVKVYTCVTTGGAPTSSDSCFVDYQTSYSYSCGTTYYLYSYATDAAGNKSNVRLHNSYYDSCSNYNYYDDDDDDDYNWNGGGDTCDNTCQMEKNSEAWHQTDDPVERERLHSENERLSRGNPDCGGDCSFDKGTGTWHDSSGDKLYNVSGGK